jgi:putative flippase GtrA
MRRLAVPSPAAAAHSCGTAEGQPRLIAGVDGRGVHEKPCRRRGGVVGRQALWFVAIGGVATAVYVGLYLGLRPVLGPQPANDVAWLLTAVLDTAANRAVTFTAAERVGQVRAQVEGMLVFGVGLALTSGTLAVLDVVVAAPGPRTELGALAVANLVAGVVRFAVLRLWVFAPGRRSAQPARGPRRDGRNVRIATSSVSSAQTAATV